MAGMIRLLALAPLLLAPSSLAGAPIPAPSPGGVLTVQLANVRNDQGRVHVDVCPQDRFLKEGCPYSAAAPARTGVTTVTVRGLPPGRYAVQAYHDENSNGKVDRLFGKLPKEGLAFSNDAFKRLAAPKWEDAQFAFAGGAQVIHVRMRYLLGASGPR